MNCLISNICVRSTENGYKIMKQRINTSKDNYEYISLIINENQINGNHIRTNNYISFLPHEYNFNDMRFYYENNFCDFTTMSKFYDKLDFYTFNDVLNFINKIGGWRICNIIPYEYSSNNRVVILYLYTFERKI